MEKEIKKNPFFAQLLEKQINNEETVKGGAESGDKPPKSTNIVDVDAFTMKYPSDTDEPSATWAYDTDK